MGLVPLISIVELANGERAGLGAVEITSVPHLSILQKRFNAIANIGCKNWKSINFETVLFWVINK